MPTDRRLIYTAQSKHFFYCRDAVCEFVFRQGCIPINPFRAFDYFLGDRVPRELVRDGNRRLLEASDEIWVFGEELADGVLVEITQAIHQSKKIRYFTIDTEADKIEDLEPSGLAFENEVSKFTGWDQTTLLRHFLSGNPDCLVQALGRREEVGRY